MRGHEPIIQARKAGMKPAAIYVEMRDYPNGVPAWSIPEQTVYVESGDNPDALDLFFVHRCFVTVSGQNAARVRRLFGAMQDHGVERCIAHVVKPGKGGAFDLVEIMDTLGVMTWHQEEEFTHG
jgi:hypothetical protein